MKKRKFGLRFKLMEFSKVHLHKLIEKDFKKLLIKKKINKNLMRIFNHFEFKVFKV